MKRSILEKVLSAPAEVLEKTLEIGRDIKHDIQNEKPVKAAADYWKTLGPGLTTGAADDDPSGIATYSQMGASRGFGMLWLAPFTLPLMGAVQEMCARIGLATGVGLAANIKRRYAKKTLVFCTLLLLFANVFNIGADLGAMAEGTRLVFPGMPFALLVIGFAVLSLCLQVFVSYKVYSKYLKYLTLVLFAYIAAALSVNMNWGEVIRNTVLPSISFSKDEILLFCAALGTTISPYLFFWQTSQEVEEQILHGAHSEADRRAATTPADIRRMRIDVWSGMFISNVVMFFIIAACAATLYANGITNIETAADAATALRPFAGDFAYALFAFGIVGTGLIAIPVLAGSASYAMSEAFGWKSGLYYKLRQATAFYGVIILALVLGIVLNFVGLDPIRALIYSAILNGLIAPVIIFLIVRLSASGEVMGTYKNSNLSNVFGWLAFAIMTVVGIAALYFLIWK